jgi:hypothetical protein
MSRLIIAVTLLALACTVCALPTSEDEWVEQNGPSQEGNAAEDAKLWQQLTYAIWEKMGGDQSSGNEWITPTQLASPTNWCTGAVGSCESAALAATSLLEQPHPQHNDKLLSAKEIEKFLEKHGAAPHNEHHPVRPSKLVYHIERDAEMTSKNNKASRRLLQPAAGFPPGYPAAGTSVAKSINSPAPAPADVTKDAQASLSAATTLNPSAAPLANNANPMTPGLKPPADPLQNADALNFLKQQTGQTQSSWASGKTAGFWNMNAALSGQPMSVTESLYQPSSLSTQEAAKSLIYSWKLQFANGMTNSQAVEAIKAASTKPAWTEYENALPAFTATYTQLLGTQMLTGNTTSLEYYGYINYYGQSACQVEGSPCNNLMVKYKQQQQNINTYKAVYEQDLHDIVPYGTNVLIQLRDLEQYGLYYTFSPEAYTNTVKEWQAGKFGSAFQASASSTSSSSTSHSWGFSASASYASFVSVGATHDQSQANQNSAASNTYLSCKSYLNMDVHGTSNTNHCVSQQDCDWTSKLAAMLQLATCAEGTGSCSCGFADDSPFTSSNAFGPNGMLKGTLTQATLCYQPAVYLEVSKAAASQFSQSTSAKVGISVGSFGFNGGMHDASASNSTNGNTAFIKVASNSTVPVLMGMTWQKTTNGCKGSGSAN